MASLFAGLASAAEQPEMPSTSEAGSTGDSFGNAEEATGDETAVTAVGDATGKDPISAKEKPSLPTLTKKVRNPDDDSWSSTAESSLGESLDYLVGCRLPTTLEQYEHYHLRLVDTLDPGLDLVCSSDDLWQSVGLVVAGHPIDAKAPVTLTYENRRIVVDFPDICEEYWKTRGLDGNSEILLSYQAQLNTQARCGAEGNDNEVVLIFTESPEGEAESSIGPAIARVFTYRLSLTKRDANSETPLEDARYVVEKASDDTQGARLGRYLQADGSLSTQQDTLSTDADGNLQLEGLTSGTYYIQEVQAPRGYERIEEPMPLSIESKRSEDERKLQSLDATATDGLSVDSIDLRAGTIKVSTHNNRSSTSGPPSSDDTPESPSPQETLAQTGSGVLSLALLAAGVALWALGRAMAWRRETTAQERSLRRHSMRKAAARVRQNPDCQTVVASHQLSHPER